MFFLPKVDQKTQGSTTFFCCKQKQQRMSKSSQGKASQSKQDVSNFFETATATLQALFENNIFKITGHQRPYDWEAVRQTVDQCQIIFN